MSDTQVLSLPEISPRMAISEVLLQTILVAVDFSSQSSRALREAIAIARCFHSEILLVHATSPTIYGTGMEPIPIPPHEMELQAAQDRMSAFIAAEPSIQQFRHREFIAYAGATDLVRRVARENNVDLVVAGSHGAGGLELLALGSVAKSILSIIPCPVLIVGPSCHDEPSLFRSILFATDLDTTGLRAAQFASSLAERFHGHLTLLHVIEKRSRRFGVQPDLEQQTIRRELTRLLPPDLSIYTSATVSVEQGSAGDAIPDFAQSVNASLIVTGFGDRSSLGDHSPWSTLSHVIRYAPCPVLSVRRHFI